MRQPVLKYISTRGILTQTFCGIAVLSLVGCGVSTSSIAPATVEPRTFSMQGNIHGGQQPVAGASIQLYAVGMPTTGGGYGQGATGLISGPLPQTDANGTFLVTSYTPPSTPSHFYLVATGGSPGVGPTLNPDIALMVAFGGCTPTVGLPATWFVNVNEVTTAAALLALQPYFAAPAAGNVIAPAIGAPSTDYNGMQNGFETANNLVDIGSGKVIDPTTNWAASAANGMVLNTLGDILATCINSYPSLDNQCTSLFAAATPSGAAFLAGDTVQSAWYIAANPTNNVSGLTNLVPPSPPFPSSMPASYSVSTPTSASACQSAVELGTAANFEVLANASVTSTGLTVVSGGDLGLSPGTSVTGFPPGVMTSPAVMQIANGSASQAQTDLGIAYTTAAALPGAALLPGTLDGLTLPPGLYATATTAGLATTLTLNAQGDTGAVFLLQIGTTLTTGTGSQVILAGGAQAKNVFWVVGTTATLGTNSMFEGNILSMSSITLNSGVTTQGRLLARGGSVTLIADSVTAP